MAKKQEGSLLSEILEDFKTNASLMRTHAKFQLSIDVDRPKFEKEHEYIDYALSVLERSIFHPLFGPMLNDLECRSDTLNKSVDKAEHFRVLGNGLFKDRRMVEALNVYTLSIAVAPPGSSQLAFAYGNRSALLFTKQYYKECMEDIERALLEMNYPEEKKDKLIRRQSKAKKLLPNQKKVAYDGVLPTITNRNPNMPSASDSIKINENKEYGRHIVATRPINPGETLLVEKPYACFVLPYDNDLTYCSECSELCYNLIPCKKCAGVLYCSKECRKKAFDAYHRHECTIMTIFGYDIINWAATRTTLKAIKEYDRKVTDAAVYRSDRYLELSKLSHYEGNNLRDNLVNNAAGPAKVFYALKKYTDVFKELDMDDKENVLKALLFKDMCVYNRNSESIAISYGILGKNIGSALYSVFSLFNHACAENVLRSDYGSTLVLKAAKKIQKGEQCFVNYGFFPMGLTVHDRQELLAKRYFFTCKCLACEQNWPFSIVTELSQEDPAVSSLCAINDEVICSKNLSNRQKSVLIEKTIQVAEKAELICPFLTYIYRHNIFNSVLFDANQNISF